MKNLSVLEDTRVTYTGKAILIGIITGFIISLFRLTIEHLLEYVKVAYIFLESNPPWIFLWVLLSMGVAFLVGHLLKSEPNIKGSGVPHVEGQLQGEIEYSWWSVLWRKFIGGLFSMGSGLFLGTEGPSIQLGATVGQGVNEHFKGKKAEKKILISSGASAGLAAAFNAPIAGLLFVLEELHHNFSPLVSLTSLASAITANFVSLNFFGLKPALYLGEVNPFPIKGYGYLILLGVFLGFLGLFYSKVLLALPSIYSKLSFLPSHLYGLVPFLLVIPIGLFFPGLLGAGNEVVFSIAKSSPTLITLIAIFVLRFIFSMVSCGANLPGGIFIPILSLGGILGCVYGNIITDISGVDSIYLLNFIMYGMAGYFTAIGKVPLTAMILVTEMVGSLNHLMPLAVVSFASYIVVDLAGAEPIYEALLENMLGKRKKILKGKSEIIEIPIEAESILDGKMIKEVQWPKETLVVKIHRGEKQIIVHGGTVIHIGDCLIVLTDEGIASQVQEQIKYMGKEYMIA